MPPPFATAGGHVATTLPTLVCSGRGSRSPSCRGCPSCLGPCPTPLPSPICPLCPPWPDLLSLPASSGGLGNSLGVLGVFLGALPLGLLGWPLGALLCPTLDDTSALQRLLHHRHDFGLPLGALLGLLKQSKKNVLLLIVTKSCAAVRPWTVSFFNVLGTFF